nr:MAG TPA: hypothetical protein [Microviridae sp.]
MVYGKHIWRLLLILLFGMVVLLSFLVFAKCPVIPELLLLNSNCLFYEVNEGFELDFVDSKINCVYRSVDPAKGSRPCENFSPTASEIGKRIEEEKRVLNLKMSAYG